MNYDIKQFQADFEKQMPKLTSAMPKTANIELYKRSAMALMSDKNGSKLLNCTKTSLFQALNRCANLGFEPGFMGESYIIPYGREAVFIIGWRGLVELARRENKDIKIDAFVVYENDEFSLDLGEDKLIHKPLIAGDRGAILGCWARAKYSGLNHIEWMRKDEIDKVRKSSKASGSGPWVDWYEEMAKKTAIRRLCKRLPMSTEDYRVVVESEQAEFRDVDVEEITDLPEGNISINEPEPTPEQEDTPDDFK